MRPRLHTWAVCLALLAGFTATLVYVIGLGFKGA